MPKPLEQISETHYQVNTNKYTQNNITQAEIMKTPFLFFQAHKGDYYNMGQQALKGIQQESPLSRLFFSRNN